MRLSVRVVPNAKQDKLVEAEGRVKVYLTAPAVEGKANKALIEFLSEHFNAKRSKIQIIKGKTSRDKVVEIGG